METAAYWIDSLGLSPHPEGGYYTETYRSSQITTVKEGERNLSTSIYFLLKGEHISHFHQLTADELWYFHAGSSTIIHMIEKNGAYHRLTLGITPQGSPSVLIPAGAIFGAEVEDSSSFTLMSCVVSPGFDFKDFKLFGRDELTALYPQHHELIKRFTMDK